MELAEFLRARMDEDERVAQGAQAVLGGGYSDDEPLTEIKLLAHRFLSNYDPARVLAEVGAKRRRS